MSAQSIIRSYQQNNVMTSDPLKLITMTYDRAIYGCYQKNLEMTWKAIRILIDSLNMDIQPLSGNLMAIYEYCNDLARDRRYDEAAAILQDLRDAWTSLSV